MTLPSFWPAGWYAVNGDPNLQREWNGQSWTGNVRPTKRIFGKALGRDPRKATAAATQFHSQIQRLQFAQGAGRRGEARVAWTTAYKHLDEAFGPDSEAAWNHALAQIQFDNSLVNSPHIGSLTTISGEPFEVFEDFVVFGTQALDTTNFTTLSVFQDGQKHVTVRNVVDKKGRARALQEVHDLRTAAIQLSGPNGTIRADIFPDHAIHAHQIAAHFNARMQAMAPAAATSADIQTMVEAILGATGQPPAEKIKQLDRLRYDRLLSDDEWNRAKSRILDQV